MTDLRCPRCNSIKIRKKGSVLSPRGRVQRYECIICYKKFHPSLLLQPITAVEGMLDIETNHAGRSTKGIGELGLMYSYALKVRGRPHIYSDYLKERTLLAEGQLLMGFIKNLKRFDRVYTYFGTRFDIPIARTRSLYHGLAFPEYMQIEHRDLYYVVRNRLNIHSNSLDAVSNFLKTKHQKDHLNIDVWIRASLGDKKAFADIHSHNVRDIVVLEEVLDKLETYFQGTNRSI